MSSVSSAVSIGPRHRGPNLGVVAIVFTVLFNIGLYFVTAFNGLPRFPGPWQSATTISAYFQARASSAAVCATFHFGAAIALGVFTAAIVSQMEFLGARVAGRYIALFGGFATAFSMIAGASVLWAISYPGIAQDAGALRALYYVQFALGGPGFSVPLGLLFAGVSVQAAFMKLLPKWLVVFGLALAVAGELSWFTLIFPKALFLIPLTRFPGFVWLIVTGFLLSGTLRRQKPAAA